METEKGGKVEARLKDVEIQLERFSKDYEGLIANRIFEEAQGRIRKWWGTWLAIVTIMLGIFGWQTYQQIVKTSQETAAKHLGKVAIEVIEDELRAGVDADLGKLRRAVQNHSLQAMTSLDGELNEAESRINKRINDFASELETRLLDSNVGPLGELVAQPESRELEAFSYYGRLDSDEKWGERFFRRENDPIEGVPQKGDLITATGQVYARSGVIEYSRESGWTNKPTVGQVLPGDRLLVLETIKVASSHVWIRFSRSPE